MKNFSKFSLILLAALMVGTAVNLAAQRNPLAKTEWIIETYGAANALQETRIISQADKKFPSIEFNAKGVGGYIAGCNSISFVYVARKRNLHVKIKSTTIMGCPGDLMKQDAEINSALGKSESFQIDGDKLEIYYDDGKVMRLRRSTR